MDIKSDSSCPQKTTTLLFSDFVEVSDFKSTNDLLNKKEREVSQVSQVFFHFIPI